MNSCEEGVSDFSSCEDVDNLNSCEEGVSDFSSSAYDENSPEDLNLDKNDDISPSVSKNALLSCADSKSSNILSKSNEATVTVTPSAQSYKYGSDVRLTIGLTGMDGIALDGLVVITLDNKQYLANVTGGSANLIVSGLENNTYSVFAEFLGNDLYESSTNSDATFVVNKSKVVTADVSVMDIVYGETATVTIANLSDVDGKTLSVFGGYQLVGPKNPYGSFFVRKGKGSFSVEGLPAGNYSAYVVFGNNVGESHEFKNYIVNFTVKKADPILSADTKDIVFGENGTVNISVLGVKTEKLNETLLITLNSEEYGSIDSVNGIANLVLPDLSVGNYTVGISFRGLNSTNYNSAECLCPFNVKKASPDLTVIGSESEWGDDSTVDVKVEHNGDPISGNVIVKVDLGGRFVYDLVALDENGEGQAVFTLKEGVAPATYAVTATFIGDDKYEEACGESILTVTGKPLVDTSITIIVSNISYGEDALIEFTLKDIDGNLLSGVLNVNVGNELREVSVTNGEGSLTLTGLKVDTYPIVANYAGGDSYSSSIATSYFKVAKNATKIIFEDMETIAVDYYNDGRVGEYFIWKLVDANGNLMANTFVQIGFNGVVYNRTTDENGEARLQINLQSIGLYTFAICFLGDESHNASFVVARIHVKAQTPVLNVPNKTFKAGAKTKALTATFKSNQGTVIANKKVTFTVNGKTYTAKTNEKGVASVNISLNKKGTYKFTAKFDGDKTYSAISKTATLKLN